MTVGLQIYRNDFALVIALRLPIDSVLWALISSLLIAVGGLMITAVLTTFIASVVAWLPALTGAMFGAVLAFELFWREVCGERH